MASVYWNQRQLPPPRDAGRSAADTVHCLFQSRQMSMHCTPESAAKVTYEVQMLRHAYEKLCELELDMGNIAPGSVMPRVGTGISTEEVRDGSVLIECLLIHARVLRYFFANEQYRDDDIVASHFFPKWASSSVDMPYIVSEKDRLDKALAHLTTKRVEFDQTGKEWDVDAIMDELNRVIERFLAERPSDRRSWFDIP